MELEELKNRWTVLEEQLKKNETVNKKVIHEMLHKKSNKSLSRLINTSFANLIGWLIAIPFSLWCYNLPRFENYIFPKILMIAILISAIIAVIWYYFPLNNLLKIDFSKHLKNNLYHINKYSIMIKNEKIFTYFGLIPLYYILGVLCYYEFNAKFFYWTFLVIAFIVGVVMTYWLYKKLIDSNIQSIKQSLEELKELKEE